MPHIVLTIAGSDPSGGAGIQADQRMIESQGCVAVSVVTALTSQNTLGVSEVYPVPPDVFRSQLRALLSDIVPDATKIGLLPSSGHVKIVAEMLAHFGLKHIVLDPVLAPTVGPQFLDKQGRDLLRSHLFPLSELVTPNAPEASAFTDMSITTPEEQSAAGSAMIRQGAPAVLVKGGHLSLQGGTVIDVLVTAVSADPRYFQHQRVSTHHTHGTGCFLSSVIASQLATGKSMYSSVGIAIRQLSEALRQPVVIGNGFGYPGRASVSDANVGEKIERLEGVYFVTDDRVREPALVVDMVRQAIEGGVKVIQLRDKNMGIPQLLIIAKELRELTKFQDALLIINDRVDIAIAADADGVHLGPDDLPLPEARRLLGDDKLIGISAGSIGEMEAYGELAGVSYLGCGPVFGTHTKSDAGQAIGLTRLTEMRERYGSIPIIGIGGITGDNIAQVRKTGVAGAAVVTAISRAPDSQAAAADLVEKWSCG